MSNPYFCELYVDTNEDIRKVEAALNSAAADAFSGIFVELPIYKNDNFQETSINKVPYDFIECSRYYVELGTVEQVPDQLSDFQSGVAVLVKSLRERGWFVTASCDFEDAIADVTGWNWTEGNPEPPGRAIAV
ncbi:MAG: hypothetical protein J0I47_14285 [Sphingomonas sp.]|uniref:hypothetical protein n=1 Tax=Sphingomonas sp. TaxID=28214 RepID=UPI001AC84364|nr:hypothetical protein [Sphingomonas sp.]MBN8809386.1 hypothetical protein [Sphingomonas sp.]